MPKDTLAFAREKLSRQVCKNRFTATLKGKAMNSPSNAITKARTIGHSAAGKAQQSSNGAAVNAGTHSHHPGDDTGRLVLAAYRTEGPDAMKAVVKSYQEGYNARASELGTETVTWEQIKSGIGWALPGATGDEETAIRAAM